MALNILLPHKIKVDGALIVISEIDGNINSN